RAMSAVHGPGPVFDFHARLAPGPGALDRLLHTVPATGIDRAAVAAGGVIDLGRLSAQIVDGGFSVAAVRNDAVLTACAASSGRLVPFYFANPLAGRWEYGEQADAFRGLELSPAVHGLPFADARMIGFVEAAGGAGH